MKEWQDWLRGRNQALIDLDLVWARRHKPVFPSPSEDDLYAALHRARYACTAIDSDLRLESAAWLRERDMTTVNGMPLLPEGQLPE